MGRGLSQGTLSGLSAAVALASLGDREHLARQLVLNREAKAFTRDAFAQAGFQVLPSDANFLMVDVRREVRGFADLCRAEGVLISRPFPPLRHPRPRLDRDDGGDAPRGAGDAVPARDAGLGTAVALDEAPWDGAC